MFYTVVRILVIAICCTAVGLSAMHMLQAQRYRIMELRKSLRRYKSMFTTEIVVAAGAFVLDWYMPILLSMAIQKEQTRQNLCNWLMMALLASNWAMRTSCTADPSGGMDLDAQNTNTSHKNSSSGCSTFTGGSRSYCQG